MASTAQTNNLRAVLLCIRSRSGAKVVFGASSTTEPTSGDDAPEVIVPAPEKLLVPANDQVASSLEITLGIKTDVLAKLLSPGRWSDGQKFEVTIGDLTFVGQPCYADDNGSWSRKPQSVELAEQEYPVPPHAIGIGEPRAREQLDFTHFADSFDSNLNSQSLATSCDSVSTRSGSLADGLLMFHVVFVLRDSHNHDDSVVLDHSLIYEHLCQPLNKALRHLQEQRRYVELECRKITAARAKAITASNKEAHLQAIMGNSEFARGLNILCRRISTNDIAILSLANSELALQIPSLTTELPLQPAALRSALLLLDDKQTILRSLDFHPEAAAMVFFITHLIPTKPLSKMASRLALPPNAVLFLAEHLIRWRKARLVAPLHARNTYVVSPDAALEGLPLLSVEYSKRFPALPSLQKMLGILAGGKPIVYGSCFPSRNHRDAYMDVLAWLLRKDLVQRLSTAGWLRLQFTGEVNAAPDGHEAESFDDSSSSVSDSGTAFMPDDKVGQSGGRFARIMSPTDMTPQERRAILALRASLSGAEMQDVFTRVLKYLDGEHALEDIAIIEGLKRSKIEECLSTLDKLAVLQTFTYA